MLVNLKVMLAGLAWQVSRGKIQSDCHARRDDYSTESVTPPLVIKDLLSSLYHPRALLYSCSNGC